MKQNNKIIKTISYWKMTYLCICFAMICNVNVIVIVIVIVNDENVPNLNIYIFVSLRFPFCLFTSILCVRKINQKYY